MSVGYEGIIQQFQIDKTFKKEILFVRTSDSIILTSIVCMHACIRWREHTHMHTTTCNHNNNELKRERIPSNNNNENQNERDEKREGERKHK